MPLFPQSAERRVYMNTAVIVIVSLILIFGFAVVASMSGGNK